jgi:hypothetical protein
MGAGRLTAAIAWLATASVACAPLVRSPSNAPVAPHAEAAGEARSFCDATSARLARCEPDHAASVAGACDAVHDASVLRGDWLRAEVACLAAPGCATVDECEMQGYRAIGVAPPDWPPIVRRCVQMGDLCGGTFATCRHLVAVVDDARAEAEQCFSMPTCDAYAACFRGFVATRLEAAVPAW